MQIAPRNSYTLASMPVEILHQIFYETGLPPKDLMAVSRACKIFYRCIVPVSNSLYWKINVASHFPFRNYEFRFRRAPFCLELFKSYVLERKKIDLAKAAFLNQGREPALALAKALVDCNDACTAHAVLQPFRKIAGLDKGVNETILSIDASFSLFNSWQATPAASFMQANHLHEPYKVKLRQKIEKYEKIVLPLALTLSETILHWQDPLEISQELYTTLYPFELLKTKSAPLEYLLFKTYIHPASPARRKKLAFDHLGQSAIDKYPPALIDLGDNEADGLHMNRNYERAFQLYETAAALGDRRGFTRLGKCFELGIGTDTDLERARKCYTEADRLGCLEGALRLGLYLKTFLADASPEYIYELFCKAAEGGLVEGAFQKAVCLAAGFGVKKDIEIAREWYLAAQQAKHPKAEAALANLLQKRAGSNADNPPPMKKSRLTSSHHVEMA